jgi:hypothetical protein
LLNSTTDVEVQGIVVEEESTFDREFTDPTSDRQGFQTLKMPVMVYTGPGEPPEWIDKADPGAFLFLSSNANADDVDSPSENTLHGPRTIHRP